MPEQPTLICLPYSPWSLKARWVLDHHKLQFRKIEYMPMLGEPWLRFKTRRLTGKVTVPVWIDGKRILTDSYAIARQAERVGQGPTLFPTGHDVEIEQWNTLSETLLEAARARFTCKSAKDPEAVLELIPPPINRIPPVARALGTFGMRFFIRKYGLDSRASDDETVLREGYDRLRAAIANNGYILDTFSYADIAMALTLFAAEPPGAPMLKLGPAAHRCMADPKLARDYADLVTWRDDLLARHHPWYH